MKSKKFDREILQQVKKLYVYDNWHALFALGSDYLLCILAIYMTEVCWWLFPLTCLIIGSRQRALATILHEASHSSLTRNKTIGKIYGTLFSGYLIFQSWDSYYKSHVKYHHPKLATTLDPDFQYYKEAKIDHKIDEKDFYWRFLWSHLLCTHVFKSFKYLIQHRLLSAPNKMEIIQILIIQGVIFGLFSGFVGWYGYVLYWLVPYLTTFQIFTWFIELSEHYPMIGWATNNLECSRNRFSHPIEHFFTSIHGENYHLVHHLFPAIPYWRLSQAHQILLKDKEYAHINAGFGGIFLSANHNKPMWRGLWREIHYV
ncbi:guanitoxin biosynthesis L-arginine gamma (S) hydroxylase [Neisseriaceae bacterium ESL0693]|nr:guanitoxin biosynthesis L-arginine gamma (S) hydroxylase [Neisseriaceae bacterium ESL0693]